MHYRIEFTLVKPGPGVPGDTIRVRVFHNGEQSGQGLYFPGHLKQSLSDLVHSAVPMKEDDTYKVDDLTEK